VLRKLLGERFRGGRERGRGDSRAGRREGGWSSGIELRALWSAGRDGQEVELEAAGLLREEYRHRKLGKGWRKVASSLRVR
jgi:hypothetical protein